MGTEGEGFPPPTYHDLRLLVIDIAVLLIAFASLILYRDGHDQLYSNTFLLAFGYVAKDGVKTVTQLPRRIGKAQTNE